ncbi:MAG: hypothetical protein AXA67_06680 [Methylothermaceae bacteria B42]|nr:MAG: hypothetical protein AXA67_06680 [Methylothermaceae bacteria B42]HHJ39775.1 LysM peptidoglycan-binding domain-containing protein [Methylothermaceae bacterium]
MLPGARLSLAGLSLLLIFFIGFADTLEAKTPKPIVTASGKKISTNDVRHRLQRLLRELGEPRWSRRELNRLTRSVSAYLRAFTGRQYDKTLAALRRGDRYRPMIRAKLARAGLPLAFEALPMAESAFRFNARSRTGARGLWQYMPASARHYGLKVGRKVDHRTDPARATDAAIKYLKFLTRKFRRTSVLLAVAAYNAGEGRIARVVRRSGVKNRRRGYSHVLRFLPRETRGYVPEFLAAALILKDPKHFGFPVSGRKNYRFAQVRNPMPVKKLARLANIPVSTLKSLNPELKKYRRIPSSNFLVRLPAKAAWRLDKKLPSTKLWKPVTTQIALNQRIQQSFKPAPKTPAQAQSVKVAKKKAVKKTISKSTSTQLVYRVKKGNYLGGIAKMFGVSVEQLRRVNHIRGNRIKVGQSLVIPINKTLTRKFYRVRSGDNLGVIARRLGIPIKHLKFVNGVTNPRRLRPGQQLYYYDS